MDCIYIAPLSKALYNLCLSFTRSHTHQRRLAAMQGTDRLVRSNRGLGVLLSDTSTRPRWDRTGNPLTARRQLLPPEPHRPNKRTRLRWAKEHRHWTVEDWKKVLWTDKSKLEVFGSHRRTFVRRQTSENMLECLMASVKHGGGNVMVWGCFGAGKVGKEICTR